MQSRLPRENKTRIPPGQPRLKLTVEGLKGNERGYWAKPEQFDELQDGGYQFVAKENVAIGSDKEGNTDLGSLVSRSGGSDGSRLYLMKIRKDWYEENQRAKQKEITSNELGMLNPDNNETNYIPGGKNTINRGNL